MAPLSGNLRQHVVSRKKLVQPALPALPVPSRRSNTRAADQQTSEPPQTTTASTDPPPSSEDLQEEPSVNAGEARQSSAIENVEEQTDTTAATNASEACESHIGMETVATNDLYRRKS